MYSKHNLRQVAYRCGTTWPLDLPGRLYFENWIAVKEIGRPQLKPPTYRWHQWKIFLIRHMMEAHCVPHNYILVFYFPIPAFNVHNKLYQQIDQNASPNIIWCSETTFRYCKIFLFLKVIFICFIPFSTS